MIKAIIQIRGYDPKKSVKLRKSIIKFMKNTKLASIVACEIVEAETISCDGKNNPKPYLKIISAKRKYATTIFEEFHKNEIHELVIISLDKMFCSAEELACGK